MRNNSGWIRLCNEDSSHIFLDSTVLFAFTIRFCTSMLRDTVPFPFRLSADLEMEGEWGDEEKEQFRRRMALQNSHKFTESTPNLNKRSY